MMKLATLFIVSCCITALPHLGLAQTVFNFDSGVNGNITGTTPHVPGGSIGNTTSGFLDDVDGTLLNSDSGPAMTLKLQTTNPVDPGFTPGAAFQFQGPASPNYVQYKGANLNDVILANVDGQPNDVLHLTFSQPITSISLQFAIVPNDFDLNGNPVVTSSLTLDGSAPASGTLDLGTGLFGLSEGSLSASGPFTSVDLTYNLAAGTDFGFAIDTVTVTSAVAPVPEPGAVALGAAGFITAAGLLRRRRK